VSRRAEDRFYCRCGGLSRVGKFVSKLKGMTETAHAQVAELIGARPREIIFTSCATEGNNAAIHAALEAGSGRG
jgi:cysteine desulfurase